MSPQQSRPVYRIAKWSQVYETSESKRHKTLSWVSLPIDFGSNGYQSLVDEFGDEAPAMYGAWCALVGVAAQAPVRGVLACSKGNPYTMARVARMTCFPVEVFERLLEWGTHRDVEWIEAVGPTDQPQDSTSTAPAAAQAAPEAQTENAGLPNTTLQNLSLSSFENDGDRKNDRIVDVPATSPQDVVDAWNRSGATTKVSKITADRKRKIATRLRDPAWPWREAIAKLPIPNDDRFCWQPDIDWLIKNETNAISLCEGKYDRAGPSASQVTAPPKANEEARQRQRQIAAQRKKSQ